MADENSLKLQITQREYVFRAIQILYDLSQEAQNDKSKICVFKARFSRIDSLRREFLEATEEVNKLMLQLQPEVNPCMKQVEAFDDLYYAVLSAAESLIPKTESGNSAAAPLSSPRRSDTYFDKPSAQARLPKIELPKFDGNIECWQTFYDTYVSLVHVNKNISSIEKFHYLISCLSGDALSMAKGVPVTADNYSIVFEALVDRFQNKRILAANYLDKICNFQQIKTNNFNELRQYTNLLNECVNALKAMKLENLGEFVLFYLASRNLDSDTRKRFETQNKVSIPTFVNLLAFLQSYVKIIEASESNAANNNNNTGIQFKRTGKPSEAWKYNYKSAALPAHVHVRAMECFGCGLAHSIYKCPKFLSLSSTDRVEFIKSKNMCGNCLRPNHNENQCFSRTSCAICGARHHTSLHGDHVGSAATSGPRASNNGQNNAYQATRTHHQASDIPENNHFVSRPEGLVENPGINTEVSNFIPSNAAVGMCASVASNATISGNDNSSSHFERGRGMVLLGTCTVLVRGTEADSPPMLVRALIDSGAQDCFMTAACAKRLGLSLRKCNVAVAGLGQNTVQQQVIGVTSCSVQPRYASEPRFNIQPIVMKNITGKMPAVEVPTSIRQTCQHLNLADDDFDKSMDVDLLLGAELFHSIYDGQRVELGPGLPVALHSVFGWVITGKINMTCQPSIATSLFTSTLSLDQVVRQFWEIEEPPAVKVCNPDDVKCEQIYSERVYQNPDGRYVVPILLKEPRETLGESYNQSLSQLLNLEKRLNRDEQLKQDYAKFMQEYETLGHMRRIDKATEKSGECIVPHHCVLRPESVSTKLRVVFNASAKSSNGTSLNDMVYTGPKLQNEIVDILTKFRTPEIVFTADICKMYRNIELRPEDRKLQHVLWRESPAEPVREYELNTVTYGVSSSPYLAIRTLHQLAKDHGDKWPNAAKVLLNDTFMDDITAGASTVSAAIELKDELIQLLEAAQFELRKWSSNSTQLLNTIPSEHCQTPKSFCDESNENMLKILGVQWDPTNDFFTYAISDFNPKCTKRAILSNVARIYDPLGWLTPLVLIAKLMLQALWRHQLSWDETIPSGYVTEWQEFVENLKHLNKVRLPRRVVPSDARRIELIGFCDGSTKAYGCCVYLRTTTDTAVHVHLLIGKSKVAPLKPLTVNRIELCSAVLLARVMKHMHNLLSSKLEISRLAAFTDSTTVLSWINTEPHKLKTFVSHRVVKIIDDIPAESWCHVSTHDNPADHCSRGLSCIQLLNCTSWWSGPSWLKEDLESWPSQEPYPVTDISELKPIEHVSHTATITDEKPMLTVLTERYSQLSRLKRVVAWCLRFIKNAKGPLEARVTSGLTTNELQQSLLILVRHEQESHFATELETIKADKTCSRDIQKLHPVLDGSGLLRVGGRLVNAQLPKADVHPLLLPKKSVLSRLIVDYYHQIYLHSGPRTLHSLVQRKFWILGMRNLIRSRLAKCVLCFKAKPIACQPLMGDLPAVRVQAARCFQNIGVDFAGPFTLKESRRRNARTYKAYVCVIVCLAVKAIHLELVTELSTPAFLAALDRFVSRRGLCKLIISDCGTNFIGAKRYFSDVDQFMKTENRDIESGLSERGISWKLNPPTGSHFGGIFESGVKSMKYHLKRVTGLQVFTFEEFMTVLTKVEAVLNSRPLCAISSDPNEVNVLTPGHFLTGGPLVALPEPDLADAYVPPLARWKMLQKLTQCFWRIWHLDYLHTLQQRVKWCKGQANIKTGDIVMIVEQNLPPLEWPVGKVVELHPGADRIVRVVTLRTAKGIFRRPVTKLCPLPIEN